MDSISKIDSITEEYGVDQAATGSAQPEPVVSVRGLVKRYGSLEAVAGIDLEVRRGEIFAFLGPNGAGKTTTVEILEGFQQRTGGQVSVLGHDPATAGGAWRDRVGVVLQESEPEPGLSVRECLAMYRRALPRAAGYRRDPRPGRSHREGGRARHQAVGRPAAPARFRPRPHRRPRAHLPGRADYRLRPVRPPRRLGGHCRAPAPRQDHLSHHPLPGRGGVSSRPHRGAVRRAHRGGGHAGHAGRARPHGHRHQLHAPRPRANG